MPEDPSECDVVALHVVDGLNEHAAGPASGVVNCLPCFWIEDLNHELDDCSWGVELAGVLFGQVGELLQEVLICVAHDVGVIGFVAEILAGKVFYEVLEPFICQFRFVGPTRIVETGKNARKSVGVASFDAIHGVDDGGADISAFVAHIIPVAALGDDEGMLLVKAGVLLIATGFFQSNLGLFVIDIRNPFEEQYRNNVALVFVLVNWPTKDVTDAEEEHGKLVSCIDCRHI